MLQNRKIIFVIISLFYSSVLFSRTVPPEMGDTAGCSVNIKMVDKTNRTKLKCYSIDFEKEQEFLDSKFLRWGTITTPRDTYITLFFTNGVHGEQAIIFSKNHQKKIKHILASWPIDLQTQNKKSKLHYKKDSDKKGKYPSFYYSFK